MLVTPATLLQSADRFLSPPFLTSLAYKNNEARDFQNAPSTLLEKIQQINCDYTVNESIAGQFSSHIYWPLLGNRRDFLLKGQFATCFILKHQIG